MKVTIDNVKECWQLYEDYMEQFRKKHYSNVKCEDFVEWCESELYLCPNCGEICYTYDIYQSERNLCNDRVCEYCVKDGYYD